MKLQRGQGIVEYALILVLIAVVVVVIVAVLAGSPSDSVNEARVIPEASLGRELIFPEGWELVTSYARSCCDGSSSFTVYICRNTDTKEYRECAPQAGAS